LSDRFRVGASYRSEIEIDIEAEGGADFNDINPGLPAMGLFTDTGALAEIDLPASLSLSAVYDISQHWSPLGDVTWIEWSRFDGLHIEFDNLN
jgi:long-chain fatty acid transport protein